MLALAAGLIAGGAVIFFRETFQLIQLLFYGTDTARFYLVAQGFEWWILLLVPTLGGLIVGVIVHTSLPERRPHGIADVIEAYGRHNGNMSLRTGMLAMITSATSIGCGASVGREGPAVHLGATLSSWLIRRLDMPPPFARIILACGVSAAVAASFNAPIAGALFASEVIIGYYALQSFAPIVIASVAGTALTRGWFGDFPAFFVSDTLFASFWEFPAFLLLGILSGFVAITLMRGIEMSQTLASRLPGPNWYHPALAGFGIGILALVFPHVLGVGYGVTEAAMTMQFSFWMLIGIVLAKIAATSLSIGFGFAGGIFSPALVIGALTGSAFGVLATTVLPEFSSGPDAYALVGMGAVAATVLGAPISTILIVFELTGDYGLTLGVMVAVVTATEISQIIYGRSFFSCQLLRRGINLVRDTGHDALHKNSISQILIDDQPGIAQTTSLADVRNALQTSLLGKLFVVDDHNSLLGTINLNDLHELAFDTCDDDTASALSVTNRDCPVISLNNDLFAVLDLMTETGEDVIAVVKTKKSMYFLGYVTHHDVMQTYTQTLMQFRDEERSF